MPTLNKVFLTGNVVRDFEKKTDKLGVVSIAQNIWNGTEEVANFYNVVLLGEKNVQSAEKVIRSIKITNSHFCHSFKLFFPYTI